MGQVMGRRRQGNFLNQKSSLSGKVVAAATFSGSIGKRKKIQCRHVLKSGRLRDLADLEDLEELIKAEKVSELGLASSQQVFLTQIYFTNM